MTHGEWIEATLSRIGGEVKRARLAAGLKQEELAHDIGISRNALQNLESPKDRRATLDVLTLMLIAHRLGMPPVELLYPALPGGEVEAWPGAKTTSFEALQWFSGEISASDIQEDDMTRSSNHRRAGLSRARSRLRDQLREARRLHLEAQVVPHASLLSKETAAFAIADTQKKISDLENLMRDEGMVVDDA